MRKVPFLAVCQRVDTSCSLFTHQLGSIPVEQVAVLDSADPVLDGSPNRRGTIRMGGNAGAAHVADNVYNRADLFRRELDSVELVGGGRNATGSGDLESARLQGEDHSGSRLQCSAVAEFLGSCAAEVGSDEAAHTLPRSIDIVFECPSQPRHNYARPQPPRPHATTPRVMAVPEASPRRPCPVRSAGAFPRRRAWVTQLDASRFRTAIAACGTWGMWNALGWARSVRISNSASKSPDQKNTPFSPHLDVV